MNSSENHYTQASIKTADNLKSIAESASALSHLSLPQVDAVVQQVARMIPAGNVPGMILSGLVRLSQDRKLSSKTVRRDINLLFKGVGQTLDKAVYSTFFAGPAAVIWGYQHLLQLSGKKTEDAFPEGVWQFYVEYAMREDTARHTNETHGFDTYLARHQIQLTPVDRITAWVMAATYILHDYNELLANEWRERIYTYLLVEITKNEADSKKYAHLYRHWNQQRPYSRGLDILSQETYPAYRQRKFEQFLAKAAKNLRRDLRQTWLTQIRHTEAEKLLAYQCQMSILAYLKPEAYGEVRLPLAPQIAHIGLIQAGNYYLIPICVPHTSQPIKVQQVRSWVTNLLNNAPPPSPLPLKLAQVQRASWPNLNRKLNPALLENLDKLHQLPILLNFDTQATHLPLSDLRQAERGVGGQPITLFNTETSMVFDMSHIFFDGAWGAALSEIMTQEAQFWAGYLQTLPAPPTQLDSLVQLNFNLSPSDINLIQAATYITPEVSAEVETIDLKAILQLRHLFKQRNDLLQLTVNDLLILYRAIHTVTYHLNPELLSKLRQMEQVDGDVGLAAQATLGALTIDQQVNPTIAMPVDASWRAPHDRLHPITLEVPLPDLDLLNLHQQTMAALMAFEQPNSNHTQRYAEFDKLQRLYLATLAGFGMVISKAKLIAGTGQSFSVGTIKLLAHLPLPVQKLLEKIPDSFDMLNDIIRGREVFSNVGAVVPDSTLTRFMSAKDDSAKKTLVWGIMTDAKGVMRITLRDFRPHVALLIQVGHRDLAVRLTQHYLDAYTLGLNHFIHDLRLITQAKKPEVKRES